MKKILFASMFFLISIILSAQEKDVTKFLGIPIDGFKPEMIQKLKAKGFTTSQNNSDVLEGEFNGTNVNIHIVTNNNKVCRIMVCDQTPISETDIKIRFNKLCEQFKNNSKYISISDYTIPEDEDISYEMNVKNKRYEAIFYQYTPEIDSTVMEKLREIYTEEELANPTEELQKIIQNLSVLKQMDKMVMKPVWFMISEYYGEYFISMFYDNEYNRANGEDL